MISGIKSNGHLENSTTVGMSQTSLENSMNPAIISIPRPDPGNNRNIRVLFTIIIFIFLMLTSFARNSVWRNEIILLEDVVSKAPNKWRGHLRLGCAYSEQNRLDQAIEQFIRGLGMTINDAPFYNNLGHSYGRKGAFALAAEMYDKAIEISPDHIAALVGRCYLRIQIGKIDLAMEDCNRAITLSPLQKDAYGNRGIAYSMIGQYDPAIKDFEQVISIDPFDENAYLNLGLAFFKAGMYAKELEFFNKAIAQYPNFAKAYCKRGAAYLHLGDTLKAVPDFRAACRMGDGEACELLQTVLSTQLDQSK